MKSEEQSLAEQRRLHPHIKPKPMEQQFTVVVPGPRALGIPWEMVTIGHNGTEMVERREATDAPANGQPLMAMSGPDAGYATEIMAALQEKARDAAKGVSELSREEQWEAVNAAWHDHIEQKLRWMKGQTTVGAAGMHQRQRIVQNPGTRPGHH